ncbi:hypothetical protein HPB49_010169 [Dermacentor silvarum]|uniref:Uncharacterized protein n=1 Tax=Dermacentor silvarum TaxID=543639 RepID=A0ACB8D403_DERSI|nr:hypothetical protein HPB49_010169 [Dermacentor silvarum]
MNYEETETHLREEDEKAQSLEVGADSTAVFQKLVKKAYLAAQACDGQEMAALKFDLRLYEGGTKSDDKMAIARIVPKAVRSGAIELPTPPPSDVALCHFGLVTSLNTVSPSKPLEFKAMAYAKLVMKKKKITKPNLFIAVNDYFGGLFGTAYGKSKSAKTGKTKRRPTLAARGALLG